MPKRERVSFRQEIMVTLKKYVTGASGTKRGVLQKNGG
jgi:hypothetical protein